jgi:small subunit ribosomal protein S13
MVYLLNTNLSNKKKISLALCDIYGLGKFQSKQICIQLGMSENLRIKQLSGFQLQQLTQLITQDYNIGIDLRRTVQQNIQRLVKIASYRGFRHTEGLTVRGQRTHGNSRTVRKLKSKVLPGTKRPNTNTRSSLQKKKLKR